MPCLPLEKSSFVSVQLMHPDARHTIMVTLIVDNGKQVAVYGHYMHSHAEDDQMFTGKLQNHSEAFSGSVGAVLSAHRRVRENGI